MFNPIQFKIDHANKRIERHRVGILMLQHARMAKDPKHYMVRYHQDCIKAEEQFIRDMSQNAIAA